MTLEAGRRGNWSPRWERGSEGAIGIVNAVTEAFVSSIPIAGSGVHSVAVNAKNGHIFVPVNSKSIFVIAQIK